MMPGIRNRIPIHPKAPHFNRMIDGRFVKSSRPLVLGGITTGGVSFGQNLSNLNALNGD